MILLWDVILVLFLLYGPLPTLLARLFHYRAIHDGRDPNAVFLTFDDGPDPLYTPKILNILREHRVKATFFLVADRAAQNPSLVKRLVDEGHEIASHGEKHQPLWVKGWRSTHADIINSIRLLSQITGVEPNWFRPPWGLVNWALLCSPWLRGKEILLWSVMPSDWRRHSSADSLVRFAARKIRGGSIIVLHDSDKSLGAAAGAPLVTIEALPRIIEIAKKRGLQFRTASEVALMKTNLSLMKMCLQSIWMAWERFFEWTVRMRSTHVYNWGIFKVFVTKYHGKSIQCDKGVWIHSGDWVGELHLNNRQILQMAREIGADRTALSVARLLRSALEQMGQAIEGMPELAKVKAFTGITLLHRGIRGLGFELHQLSSNWFRSITTIYLRFLLSIFHPSGKKRIAGKTEKLVPMLLILTKESLLEHYSVKREEGGVV